MTLCNQLKSIKKVIQKNTIKTNLFLHFSNSSSNVLFSVKYFDLLIEVGC